ncbi:MAG: 4-phosphoerythronate dehydrogenase [Colwellia sp.]
MNIYFDENMPFAKEFFSDFGELFPFSGRDLTAEQIIDADVLLVRSITQVNEQLLNKNKKLCFVGTATIGTDHIDQTYLADRNIAFYSAPGCNAVSVAEYVISALVILSERYCLDLPHLTVGIVGAGNTGTRLSEKLTALGIHYKLCDPFLAEDKKDNRTFVSLDEALNCDIISLHVPKTTDGPHATYHLLNEENLAKLRPEQLLISACRGEVIDNQALLALKKNGHEIKLVLDVWEGEPKVLTPLIEYTEIATAHIAGYSLEGKARGTEMLYQALCQQLIIQPKYQLVNFLPPVKDAIVEINQLFEQKLVNQLVKMVYDVRRDDTIFRQQLSSQGFDAIRKNYPTRREFSSVTVTLSKQAKTDVPHRLGFSRIN